MIGAMNPEQRVSSRDWQQRGYRQCSLKRPARHFGSTTQGNDSIYSVPLFLSACDNYFPQIENNSLRWPPLAYFVKAEKQEEGRKAKGQMRVTLVAFKGSAHFCLTCWASSLLTGVLFHKGI